jgi:NADH:ubiquinone oxidoreductase subunit 6 (subunit J)
MGEGAEHHGREYLLTGAGLFVELLAVLLGEYGLAVGAAFFFWLALVSYLKECLRTRTRTERIAFHTVSPVMILALMCSLPYLKERTSKHKEIAEQPAPRPNPQRIPSVRPEAKNSTRPEGTRSAHHVEH